MTPDRPPLGVPPHATPQAPSNAYPAYPVTPFAAGRAGPAAHADGKAVLSLVFGILSLFGCGALFAAPAIVLGVMARREAARAGGNVSGEGLAMGGIVTGTIGAAVTALAVLVGVAGLTAGLVASRGEPAPRAPAAPAPTAASPADEPESQEPRAKPVVVQTSIDVVTLSPTSKRLRDQLRGEVRLAEAQGEKLLVQTTASWAPVCGEIDVSLGDPRMETALAKVRLVRVDVDSFETDLKAMRMYEGSVPWFFTIDPKTARPVDAIGADEWDDNVPENMAPVLGSFVKGTYRDRRHGSPLGGTAL